MTGCLPHQLHTAYPGHRELCIRPVPLHVRDVSVEPCMPATLSLPPSPSHLSQRRISLLSGPRPSAPFDFFCSDYLLTLYDLRRRQKQISDPNDRIETPTNFTPLCSSPLFFMSRRFICAKSSFPLFWPPIDVHAALADSVPRFRCFFEGIEVSN